MEVEEAAGVDIQEEKSGDSVYSLRHYKHILGLIGFWYLQFYIVNDELLLFVVMDDGLLLFEFEDWLIWLFDELFKVDELFTLTVMFVELVCWLEFDEFYNDWFLFIFRLDD